MRLQYLDDGAIKPGIVTFQQSASAFEASRVGTNIDDPLLQYGLSSALFWLRRCLDEMTVGINKMDDGKTSAKILAIDTRRSAMGFVRSVEDFLSLKGVPESVLKNFNYHKARMDLEIQKAEIGKRQAEMARPE
jgi:hypothetical protein